jgi:predicted dehydrogenase
MSKSRPVKVAMIGLGWWGKTMTAVLNKATGDVEIACAAESNPSGKEFAEPRASSATVAKRRSSRRARRG